jgi:hypothetical protein
MSRQIQTKAPGPAPGTDLIAQLGGARLLPGEDETSFRQFCERALEEIKPRDLIEEDLLVDYIYHAWEAMRYRRYRTNLLRLASSRSAAVLATTSSGGALQEVDILGEADTVMCDAFAETLAGKLHLIAGIDRLLESAEARRIRAHHELQCYRKALAAQAHAAVERIEDAEFRNLHEDKRLKNYVDG